MRCKGIKIKTIALFFALMTLSAFARAESVIQPKIVGGTTSTQGDYPWMVALVRTGYTVYQGQFCGGSLVAPQWVLTAAHCVTDLSTSSFSVYIGEYDLDFPSGEQRSVSKILVHPEYDAATSDNDLALVKLSSASSKTPVAYVDAAETVLATKLDVSNGVRVIGWGGLLATSGDDGVTQSYPSLLQEVDVTYISNTACNAQPALGNGVTDNMMCAGENAGGQDSCQGDSGGPLIYQDSGVWYQAGIVSWGAGCAQADSYGVYTRVSKYTQWIDLVTQGIEITPSLAMGSWITGLTATGSIDVSNAASNMTMNIAVTPASSDITVTNNCSTTLTPGESCTIDVSYNTSLGSLSDSVTITSDQYFTSVTIPVTANSVSESFFNLVESSSAIQWALAGNAAWSEQRVTNDGGYSFQSGDITDSQSSSLFAYVNLPSGTPSRNVYFHWKVCSEADFDFLELWVDNRKIQSISGNVDWSNKTVTLNGEGDHVIEWRYNKDFTVTDGADAGWLDNIYLDSQTASLPVHNASCQLSTSTYPVAPPPGGGGGAASPWMLLLTGIPFIFRRRRA